MSTEQPIPTIGPRVEVVADSISPITGDRLTSLQVTLHRLVLAELNTHATASRNSASSRAIPAPKQLQRYQEEPAWPLSLPCEQPGMSGGPELSGASLQDAINLLTEIHTRTGTAVSSYLETHPDPATRLHKSVINRYLEPLQYHTVLYTASAWRNFLAQRAHHDAMPEFRAAAELIDTALREHTPTPLSRGEWHLPYLRHKEAASLQAAGIDPRCVSAARCARTSYMTQAGDRDPAADQALFERLVSSNHWSPLEHIATPDPTNVQIVTIRDPDNSDEPVCGPNQLLATRRVPVFGKWAGWQQFRHLVEAQSGWDSHV